MKPMTYNSDSYHSHISLFFKASWLFTNFLPGPICTTLT